jgi:uncharacterized membrane protein YkoI
MNRRRIVAGSFVTVLCIACATGSASADDKGERAQRPRASEPKAQHDQVLDALKRDEIRPFTDIQAAAQTAMPGQVVGVEVKRRAGRLVYEFKIISAQGRLREVYVDAGSLDIVKVE